MSTTETTERDTSQYSLEPDIDSDLVEEMNEYSLRKDGKYVEGRISEISKRGGKIHLTVDLPRRSFTDSFVEPDPEHAEFEQIANEYGIGLVDIGYLHGETVWCTKSMGAWSIVIRPSRRERFFDRVQPSEEGWFWPMLFAPLLAFLILDKKAKADRWSHKSHPSQEHVDWSRGVFYMVGATVFWTCLFVITGLFIV